MIRQVVNGKLSEQPDVIYCVKNGKTMKGKKLYIVQGGRTQFLWQEKGTRDNPYRIYTASDLYKVRLHPDAYFLQMNDVYGVTGPILPDQPFTGVYDGQGYYLGGSSSTYVDSNASKQAFFCTENNGIITRVKIKHIKFKQSNLGGYKRRAGVVCTNNGIIDQVYALTDRVSDNYYANYYSNSVSAVITEYNYGKIQNCYATLNYITQKRGYENGIAKFNIGEINQCVVKGDGFGFYNNNGLIAGKLIAGSRTTNCGYSAASDATVRAYGYMDENAVVENVGEGCYTEKPTFQTIIY